MGRLDPGSGPGLGRRFDPGHCALGALAIAAAIAAGVPSAGAADLPAPVPAATAYVPNAYQPATYSWTGIYLGGRVGVGFDQETFTQTNATTTAGIPFGAAGTQSNIFAYAVLGGPQLGANLQVGPVVFGVEGSFDFSDVSGTAIIPTLQTSTLGFTLRSKSTPYWYATATGRVGYAFDTLLPYVKGGAAWMRVDYDEDVLTTAGNAVSTQGFGDTRTGFIVGGGLEYGMTERLSAKVEYDFLDFGTKDYTFNALSTSTTVGLLTFTTPVDPMTTAIKSYQHLITVGIDYRFIGSGG